MSWNVKNAKINKLKNQAKLSKQGNIADIQNYLK